MRHVLAALPGTVYYVSNVTRHITGMERSRNVPLVLILPGVVSFQGGTARRGG